MAWASETIPPAIYAFLVVNSVAVGLRVYVRTFLSKSFGYDDIAMVLAFIGYITLSALTLTSLRNGYGNPDQANPAFDIVKGVKFFVASTIAYVIVIYVAKVSVALVLFRIAVTSKRVRILLGVSIGILTVWTATTSLIVGLQCVPLSLAWGEMVPGGHCLPAYVLANTGYSISAMDIASSFLYAALPIYLLREVQLSTRVKTSVVALLGLGVISSVVTVIRLKYLVDVGKLKSPTGVEAENAYLTTFVYSIVELGLTIFTASLAALRPLLKFMPFGQTTNPNYGNSYAHSQSKQSRSRAEMGNNVQLRDFNDADSTEFIIPGRVHKSVKYEVKFEEA